MRREKIYILLKLGHLGPASEMSFETPMTFHWWVDDGLTLKAGLVSF